MSLTTTLEHGTARLSPVVEGERVIGLTLDCRDGDGWRTYARVQPLSRLVYRDKAGNRQAVELAATSVQAEPDGLVLTGDYGDADGVTWRLTVRIAQAVEPDEFTVGYTLEADAAAQVLDWRGPALHVGADIGGNPRDEALFPGLEYLLDDEPSSDTRFAAEKYANRTIPHPYRIAIPLMAVAGHGRAVGLLWDPNQDWHSAWRHPAALFAAPDTLSGRGGLAYMALAAPAVEPRWRNEGELEAHQPCGIGPSSPFTLSGRFVALGEGGVMGVLRAWLAAYGAPALPEVAGGEDYRANVDLCVRSYLDVAWDEAAEGWHHTLSDPWGPRYEAHLANQLWRYARWPQADAGLAARAREQVQRGVRRGQQAAAAADKPRYAPHPDLALVYGDVSNALTTLAGTAATLLAEQQADGSWPWQPDVVAGGEQYHTADRLALMGREHDSATGFTASKVRPVLQYALLTGDQAAVAAVLRAADWCNAQGRPEGAQTWELHLHVPDVLAAPYLIDLNLGAYELTGDERYLDAATRWAWTGLPFTYLWHAYYRPVMLFGTVPVFGVTFHDVQSWFGVIVQWNGLVYADALFRLARYRRADGPADWQHIAEGITRHGMQEQMRAGPHLGMYPDAFSPVRGDEEYTWWLNPQLVGLNTFPLAGLPLDLDPVVLRDEAAAVHITSGAVLRAATRIEGGTLVLELEDQPGASSVTLIGGRGKPAHCTCGDEPLPEVTDLDAEPQGWQWLAEHHVAAIKVRFDTPQKTVSVM